MKNECKVAVYTRVNNQSGHLTEHQQQALCLNLAKTQFGADVKVEYYSDRGMSGRTFEREGMQRLLKDVTNNRFIAVLAYDASRICRSLSDYCNFTTMLNESNVQFMTVTMNGAHSSHVDYHKIFKDLLQRGRKEDMSRRIKKGLKNRIEKV